MNCEKFTRNQSGNILVHCDRSDPNRTYKNQEIDHSKTYLNYNLAPEHTGMTDYEFMKKRCEEFKVLKRKDVNWLVSWVITMPTDYKGNKALFFREAYNFMANRYGKGNVVSAYVHLDETSPHMHFCFVPVIFDKKKQEYKVNAKQCINKVELKQIHPEMQEYLENKLQTKVNILNGATAEGNKTVEQLKNEEKIKEKAIVELIQNPTEEIKKSVIEQIPVEQKENIIEEEIEIIKNELNRTLTIMDDFMNYTKIKVNLDIIDINMLLNEVLESFSLIFKINNIDLINKVTDDEIYINGDYDRLKQVFINLIKNGIESFDGKKGKLEINTKENNKEVIISIIDNGCGMDEDILKNINEMFYTTKKNGTGIGLPLSNEIIKLHNGKLNFYSKKGKGTTVEIIFNKVDIN